MACVCKVRNMCFSSYCLWVQINIPIEEVRHFWGKLGYFFPRRFLPPPSIRLQFRNAPCSRGGKKAGESPFFPSFSFFFVGEDANAKNRTWRRRRKVPIGRTSKEEVMTAPPLLPPPPSSFIKPSTKSQSWKQVPKLYSKKVADFTLIFDAFSRRFLWFWRNGFF